MEKTEDSLYPGERPLTNPVKIYTNDQPLHGGTRSFIYADDLYVTVQYSSFTEVERIIG